MALPEFTWMPDVGSQVECEPTINSTKFGDGYELRVPKGINFMPEKWQVTFERDVAEIKLICNFLKERGGYLPFIWKSPLEETKTYICRKWSNARGTGTSKVTCTFEQVFDPE